MAYMVDGLSFVPRYCPAFKTINEDGSDFDIKAQLAKIKNLGFTPPSSVDGLGIKLPDAVIDTYPKYAVLESSHKNLPNIFTVPGGSCVNQTLRDLIEALEPNVHQFIPIALFDKKKNGIEGNFKFLIIAQQLNSIIRAKSSVMMDTGLIIGKKITMISQQIQGKHLWRERNTISQFFISDELHDQFEKRKFKGIDKLAMHKIIEE